MADSLWQLTLADAQTEVASTQPAPAGVATAAITAALALSLLVKVLRITGQRDDLLTHAEPLIETLRTIADEDVAAVRAYIATRETGALQAVPKRAADAVLRAIELCDQAHGDIKGLIIADVRVARSLLQGSADAIAACIAANR
jgi:formiminotetrahydrofolate cyclodeaminase